ncbi:CPBP family intramembrane glutamic endopeptidase [Actinomyces sp. ZJ308]|uniref:CPBP family intramembrane glutamic endopeptidase n=1 Tax=Actinomyces sp. ZJ308 TaxID=2708342 RepID=UPI001422A4E9|nr:CPBP family intramembrane glutamic endopeptidase [Actinomyces sp. ZJ308]
MAARPGSQREVVPPGAVSAPAGAEATRTRWSAWAALILLIGGLSIGVVLALAGGPWQVLAVLHLGALAIWFLVWRRSWRDLLRSAGPRSPWLLFAVGAGLCALSAVARRPIDDPGAVLAPVTLTGLLSALASAVGVGVLMNAVPEELSLRRCLLEPLRAQFGDRFALWVTALAFVGIHLPTWISSGATASIYAAEVPEKLFFGLVAGWSVLRLDSLAFALGMHVGGNVVGVLLDSLSRQDTLTGWSRLTAPVVVATLIETTAAAGAVWYLSRKPGAGR